MAGSEKKYITDRTFLLEYKSIAYQILKGPVLIDV